MKSVNLSISTQRLVHGSKAEGRASESQFFSHLGFWSGNFFLIAPFPDLCLLVPFCKNNKTEIL